LAASEDRSTSQQVLFLLKQHPAPVLLKLFRSWEDDRLADLILKELKTDIEYEL